MSIITKPAVVKGTPATFTLSKVGLLLHPLVVADSYFSNSDNWYRVNVIYKSSPGSQYEIVEFDASQSSSTGVFLISEKARDLFQVQKLQILDFDGGFLEIGRADLVTADWDVSITPEEPEIAPLASSESGAISLVGASFNTVYTTNQEFNLGSGWQNLRVINFITPQGLPLMDNILYKVRFHFNSLSSEVPQLTMKLITGYGDMPVVSYADALSSITQNGYVDFEARFYLQAQNQLQVIENDGYETPGQASFSISKIEILPF